MENEKDKDIINEENEIDNSSVNLENSEAFAIEEINNEVLNNKSVEQKEKKEMQIRKDKFSSKEVVILIVITCIVNFIFMAFISDRLFNKSSNQSKIEVTELQDENLKSIVEHYQYIMKNFYDINGNVDEKDIVNGAIKGMTEALGDEHSTFIPANDDTYDTTLNGEYQGLGVEIAQNIEDGKIYVLRIFAGSSAEMAGLKVGDAIISLDGVSSTQFTTSEFSNKVKNGTAQTFILGILRDGKELTIEVNKSRVVIESVASEVIEKNNQKIGYIGVSVFAANTDQQFHSHLEKLETTGIDSLIIDLRGNTGGHLTAVTNMISEFLDRDKVIYQTDKQGVIEKFYSLGKQTKKYPVVILADGASASASEVMIGALTEQLNAKLVGEKTYGKGTAQELIQINGTGESYKITTKKWLTPNGNWIDGTGFMPDYVVELSEKYYENPTRGNDNQLAKAIEILTNK